MLFNELYYVVDGGAVWLDSTNGVSNCPITIGDVEGILDVESRLKRLRSSIDLFDTAEESVGSELLKNDSNVQSCEGRSNVVGQFLYLEGHEYLMYGSLLISCII
jgi:hypothetical protein